MHILGCYAHTHWLGRLLLNKSLRGAMSVCDKGFAKVRRGNPKCSCETLSVAVIPEAKSIVGWAYLPNKIILKIIFLEDIKKLNMLHNVHV